MPPRPSSPRRRNLPHDVPNWVAPTSLFFVTVCARPRGANVLCHGGLAERVAESVAFRVEQRQWDVPLLLLMPDHVHLLARFDPKRGMPRVVSDWKRYLARHSGVRWQRDFFDHRIRSDEERNRKVAYVRENPVRAGLVERAEDWPFVWTFGTE